MARRNSTTVHSVPFDVDGLPYAEVVGQLLNGVFGALHVLARARLDGRQIESLGNEDYREINSAFSFLADRPREGINRHLNYYVAVDELPILRTTSTRSNKVDGSRFSRIGSLIANSFDRVDELERWRINAAPNKTARREKPVAFLPSPIAILYDLLVDPEDLSTRAYALVAIRNVLLRSFKVIPSGFGDVPEGWNMMTQSDVAKSLSTVSTFFHGRDNIPAARQIPVDAFVRHFLAAKGLLHLRFGSRDNKQSDGMTDRVAYCNQRVLQPNNPPFEFRADPELAHIPPLSEIENEIWGVPLPLRGADVVFYGGLKFSETGGLVVGISGGPGTGKTSFALSIAGRLAPLQVKTIYITAEEAPEDLYTRLASIVSDRIKRLSFAPAYDPKGSKEWLVIRSGRGSDGARQTLGPDILTDFIEQARARREDSKKPKVSKLPATQPCKFVVIIDNLHSFIPSQSKDGEGPDKDQILEKLIAECRTIGALVIATFAKDWWGAGWVDYFIDSSIHLEYEQTDIRGLKPARLMILRKTRQQISRPGAHGFHLSGDAGFRIAPQIPSQLDRRAIFETSLPDQDWRIEVFRRPVYRDTLLALPSISGTGPVPRLVLASADRQLRIAKNSHVLLHGTGSGGKAGLALKIAAAPLFPINIRGEKAFRQRRRVLVVSFLYPEEYYVNLFDHLVKLAEAEYDNLDGRLVRDVGVNVLTLYPGYIQPEDLFDRISRRLDSAELSGFPYTSIVLDGLHNISLQFPLLQNYPMLWPVLYSTLRRRKLTVITTHTIITVESGLTSGEPIRIDDPRTMPLLQAFVQSSDYVIAVDRISDPKALWGADSDQIGAAMQVKIVSSNFQAIPQDEIYWSRDKLVLFVNAVSQRELPLEKRE